MNIKTPVSKQTIEKLNVGDKIYISGIIYTGRDAALPKLVDSIKNNEIQLENTAIMHTAVSPAGIAPTSSNKAEIQSHIPFLSENGVRIHIGKGKLNDDTVKALERYNSVFVITPPVAALLTSKVLKKECFAFESEGMEAMYKLKVDKIPGIVGVAKGKSI